MRKIVVRQYASQTSWKGTEVNQFEEWEFENKSDALAFRDDLIAGTTISKFSSKNIEIYERSFRNKCV